MFRKSPHEGGRSPHVNKNVVFPVAAVGGFIVGALVVGGVRATGLLARGPSVQTMAAASLVSVREQARLTPFSARFVAVVTSAQARFGLRAQKTLIVPGTVRYEIDLAALQAGDLKWDATHKTLTVTLPPLEVSAPEIELNDLREYGEGGVLMALTNAEAQLDSTNRQRGQEELGRQAREAMPMRLAREAARRAIERSFGMPMKAAGLDATVVVRFADDPDVSLLNDR